MLCTYILHPLQFLIVFMSHACMHAELIELINFSEIKS
jgi:hypothetical protein